MKHVLAILSFKGGTAKTSTVLHMGVAWSLLYNKKVLLIDFDAQANLTAGLGIDPDSCDSLAAVLQEQKSLAEVVVSTPYPHLDLIPADSWLERVEVTGKLATDRYAHEKLKKLIAPLDYDIILIDTPPSLCWLTESALTAATHALICATPEFYSIKGLQRLAYFMHYIGERHPFELLGVVLSFWNERGKNNSHFLKIIEEIFPGKLLHTRIRRDIAVSEAAIHGRSVFAMKPSSRAAGDYKALAQELGGKLSSSLTSEFLCPN